MTLRIHPEQIVARSDSPLLGAHATWSRVQLGDVATVLNGFAFKSALFSREDGLPLLRIRDVGRSATDARYVGDFDPRYIIDPGSIVVGMDGDFRVARWSGPPALLNQRVCKIAVRDAVAYDPNLLYYVLPGYLDAIHSYTSSVTVKHLSSRTISEIPLPLPPIEEQRRIVTAIEEQFSRIDAADDSLGRAERMLVRLRNSVVADAVSGPWPVVRLGDVTESQIYGTGAKASRDSTGVPVLRMSNIRNGVLDFTDLKYLPDGHADIAKCRLIPGDLLFNRTNSPELVGKSAVFTSGPDLTVFASYLIRVRLTNNCDPRWAALVINSELGRQYIARVRTQQVGQANVNGTKLAAMAIPLPPVEVQRRILERIDEWTGRIQAVASATNGSRRRSDVLRRSILGLAFSGRLVRQDPTDRPASALLEQIAAARTSNADVSRRRKRLPA